MVQLGNRDSTKLLESIRCSTLYTHPSIDDSSLGSADAESVLEQDLSHPLEETEVDRLSTPSDACQETAPSSSMLQAKQTAKGGELQQEPSACQLYVTNFPPLPQRGPSKPVITNELLCFIQNRMKTLSADDIVRLCQKFYGPEVICSSKKVLFDSTFHCRRPEERYIKRKGDNKARDDLRDMIKLFLTLELKDCPVFVARNLSNLPPLSAGDQDILGLVQEIERLKSSMQILKDCQKDSSELTQLVSSLTNVPSVTDNKLEPVNNNSNTSSTSRAERSGSVTSVNGGAQDDINPTEVPQSEEFVVIDSVSWSDNASTSTPFSEVVQGRHSKNNIVPRNIRDTAAQDRQPRPVQHGHMGEHRRWNPPIDHQREELSTKHRQNQNRNVMIGSGQGSYLKAVSQEQYSGGQTHNRAVTGVFLSRLDPKTTSAQLALHVHREARLTVRPEKLETRYSGYSSFYIRADHRHRNTLFDSYMWPTGCLIKPYYE
jgi:hypothetical protein